MNVAELNDAALDETLDPDGRIGDIKSAPR